MIRRVLVKTSAMLSDDHDLLECEHWVERVEPYGALERDCPKCQEIEVLVEKYQPAFPGMTGIKLRALALDEKKIPSNPIRNILDDFIESQGWDDESTIALLCDFLDSANVNVNLDRFRTYLQQRVESENLETK